MLSDDVVSKAEGLFSDAVDEFADLTAVMERVAQWRRDDPQSFNDAYVQLSLHDVVGPYIRAEVRPRVRCRVDAVRGRVVVGCT